ncbi:MAG: DedA family protein [Conexibacter sp.]|nr:DedA family protein [Conexibacter sp.]
MLITAALVLASVTDKLATFATNVVGDLGLPGIFLLMVPESACIPIPSEATMLFAGFNVSEGKYSLFAAVAVGSIANLVGSWIAYAVGYYGRVEVLERYKVFHIKPEQLAMTERWFERWGSWAVFFSRMLPIVRTFISLPAGIARMPFRRFAVLTFLGALPWNAGLVLAGYAARDNWEDLRGYLHLIDYAVVVLIVAGAGYLAYRWWKNRGTGGTPAAAAEDAA